MERSACVADCDLAKHHSVQHMLGDIPRRLSAATVTSLNGRMMMQDCNHLIEHAIQQVSAGSTGLAEIMDSRTPLKELCMRADQSDLQSVHALGLDVWKR